MITENDNDLDITKLKYVLYARKSTDDPERQVRSVEDQIVECEQLAIRLGIHLVKPHIIEKKSAKRPGQRPLFRQMVNDIRKGVYDGIVAWNPDRLARNMKEGGEIIDMVDEDLIKDMRFVTHHFSKDANGKMLLGMAFVLSKQYSDKLSQDVTRGLHRKVEEGKSHIPKHGYIKDEEGLYRPDGRNFELICEAWAMRKEGTSLEQIEEYLDKEGYQRIIKTSGKPVKLTFKRLSDLFKDPFYYGLLIQGAKQIDLREVYEFKQAVTEADYNQIQQLFYNKTKPYRTRRLSFYPLKLMLKCSFCNRNMVIAPSTGSTKRYLNARCDNKFCLRKKKSIRMINVFNFIYDFLDKGLNFTEKDYNDYYKGMTKYSEAKQQKIQIEVHSKQAILRNIDIEVRERALKVLDFEKSSTVRKVNEDKIAELEDQKEQLKEQIAKLQQQIAEPEKDMLTLEEFLNLSKNAAAVVKSGDAIIKDQICRLIFLNFTVDEAKVASYQLKEPFTTLLKQRSLSFGRGGQN